MWIFLGVECHRGLKEKALRPMEFDLCSLACRVFKKPQKLCVYALYYMFYCSGGFSVCVCRYVGPVCEGHDADVPRTGM